MTNLISELADQILTLINSKPRSPTKAEVEEVIRPVCMTLQMLRDADELRSYPGRRTVTMPAGKEYIMPLPCKPISTEMLELIEAMRDHKAEYLVSPRVDAWKRLWTIKDPKPK